MTALLENIHVALPEIILLTAACVALLADLFLRDRCKSIAYFISCIGLVLAAVVTFLYIGTFKVITLNGLFISDDVANLMKFLYIFRYC